MDLTSSLGLPFDNAVGNPHLTAQGKQEDNQLNGMRVVCSRLPVVPSSSHQSGDSVPLSKGQVAPWGRNLLSLTLLTFFSAWANNLFSVLVGQL